MRITVVGPGAVGLLWAGRLHQAGADVRILDHSPRRAAALDRDGFILEDGSGETLIMVPVSADPATLAETDLALVCVKAYDTKSAARVLGENLSPGGRALTLQNGAGALETLCEALGPERVLGGITSEGSTLLAPDRVRHAGKGLTHLGPAQGPVDDFTRRAADILNQAGFQASPAQGAANLIWTKLLINVGINALTALLNAPNGRLLELARARDTMARAVAEAEAVGRALGVEFLHQDMLAAVEDVARRTANNISSMLQDVRAQKRTEVEFINGAVCREGRKQGLPTPVNQTLTDLVLSLQEDYL